MCAMLVMEGMVGDLTCREISMSTRRNIGSGDSRRFDVLNPLRMQSRPGKLDRNDQLTDSETLASGSRGLEATVSRPTSRWGPVAL